MQMAPASLQVLERVSALVPATRTSAADSKPWTLHSLQVWIGRVQLPRLRAFTGDEQMRCSITPRRGQPRTQGAHGCGLQGGKRPLSQSAPVSLASGFDTAGQNGPSVALQSLANPTRELPLLGPALVRSSLLAWFLRAACRERSARATPLQKHRDYVSRSCAVTSQRGLMTETGLTRHSTGVFDLGMVMALVIGACTAVLVFRALLEVM